MNESRLLEQFGQIDIYLFDQILRGHIVHGMRILDVGCGGGRNLVYFLQQGFEVFAVDADPHAISTTRHLAETLAPHLPVTNFHCEPIESMSFPDSFAELVLSNAVLHFARSEAHFATLLRSSWRVLAPGGLFFCRLASSIGIEHQIQRIEGRRFLLPDGSERFLVDEALLNQFAIEFNAQWVDPLKTTVVQNQRSMTTVVLRKPI